MWRIVKQQSVTIVLPAHHEGALLNQALRSATSQTFRNWELRLFLDNADEKTTHIAESWAATDSRIQINRVFFGSCGRTLAVATEGIQSDFIVRMDADDVSQSGRIHAQIAFMRENYNVVVAGSNARFIDAEGQPFGFSRQAVHHQHILNELLSGRGSAIYQPSAIVRTEAFHAAGGYSGGYHTGEDLDLFLRLSQIGQLANDPEVLLDFRRHLHSVTFGELEAQAVSRRRETIESFVAKSGYKGPLPPAVRYQRLSKSTLNAHIFLHAFYDSFWKTAIVYLGRCFLTPSSFGYMSRSLIAKLWSSLSGPRRSLSIHRKQ